MTTVADIIAQREITEILHFTTNRGVLGTFARSALRPRSVLPEDKYLEHVYTPNSSTRKDPGWTGHCSLSISRVNTDFFGVSQHWHKDRDVWWAILAFDPVILTHDDVVFVTTNNIYPKAIRGQGAEGLERLFADPVYGRYSDVHRRYDGMPDSWTTHVQAEVLYPGDVPASFVRRVYVVSDDHADLVASQYDILLRGGRASEPRPELPIDVRPELFE